MAVHKFPGEGQSNQEEPVQRPMPEFIVIEENVENAQEGHQQGFSEEIQRISHINVPIWMRLFFLLFGAISLIWFFISMAVFSVYTLLSALFLYRSKGLNQMSEKYWRSVKKATVFALGSIVAFFSPVFGVGIILIYFTVNHEKDGFFAKMMRSSLHDNFGTNL